MERYRLYIDESGTHSYSDADTVKQRYLALIGVAIGESQNIDVLQPRMLELKRLIADDPDDLPIFHREDIVNKKGVFAKLGDPGLEKEFNDRYLSLLSDLDYTLCTVVLDKKSHLDRYQKAAHHPYHYCTDVLVERYTFTLQQKNGRGDVLAEARGKSEDQALKEQYQRFYENGTQYCRPPHIQQYLTSREIKIKPKSKGLVGLEFADLLSLATKLDTLHTYGIIAPLTDNFTKVIVDAIQPKYRTSPTGEVKGFGKKFIN